MKRAEGGGGIISIEECVNVKINSLNKYLARSQEWMLKAVFKEEVRKGASPNFGRSNFRLFGSHIGNSSATIPMKSED